MANGNSWPTESAGLNAPPSDECHDESKNLGLKLGLLSSFLRFRAFSVRSLASLSSARPLAIRLGSGPKTATMGAAGREDRDRSRDRDRKGLDLDVLRPPPRV